MKCQVITYCFFLLSVTSVWGAASALLPGFWRNPLTVVTAVIILIMWSIAYRFSGINGGQKTALEFDGFD